MKCAQSAHVKNAGRVLWPFLIQFVIVQWVIPHKYPFHSTILCAPNTLCQAELICAVKRAQLWGTAGSYACMYVSCLVSLRPASSVLLPVGVPVIRSIKLKRLLMCKPHTRPRPRPSLRLCLSTWQCRSGFGIVSHPVPPVVSSAVQTMPWPLFPQLVWQPKPKGSCFSQGTINFLMQLEM